MVLDGEVEIVLQPFPSVASRSRLRRLTEQTNCPTYLPKWCKRTTEIPTDCTRSDIVHMSRLCLSRWCEAHLCTGILNLLHALYFPRWSVSVVVA